VSRTRDRSAAKPPDEVLRIAQLLEDVPGSRTQDLGWPQQDAIAEAWTRSPTVIGRLVTELATYTDDEITGLSTSPAIRIRNELLAKVRAVIAESD
jgi:hypothetical protein